MCLGSSQTPGGTYKSTDDPRFERITESMRWFKGWHDRVMSQPLTDQLSTEGRSMQFISYQCWYDLQITASSFIGLCSYWLPKAPEGCGIHPTRCSQDPVEAYFNYVRSCGGANSHPTIAECFAAGAGYSTTAVLSKHANNGVAMDGARGAGARNKRVFDDDDTLAFPLHGRRGGSWRRDDDRDSGGQTGTIDD